MRRTVLVLFGLLLAACGGTVPVGSVGPSEGPAGLAIRYTCGQVPFDPAILEGPSGAEQRADPAAVALREFLGRGGLESEGLPDTGWILVGGTPVLAEFVAPDEAGDWDFVSVEQQQGT